MIYFRLVQTLGPVGTTAQAYLRVPIGVAIGVVFLGESLGATALIGLACVIAGVAAMTVPTRTLASVRRAPMGSRIARIVRLVLCVWPERQRQRAQLLELEPEHLRDIGVDGPDALREGHKPFWH